jgi:GT2 family glycosyltransferase
VQPCEGVVPGVSVVVGSHAGRLPWLRRLLVSLAVAGGRCPEPSEVVIVDDSPEPEASRVREVCDEHGARYLRGPARAGSKRNVGARSARFDVLLFTDSDCAADPELLVEHLRTMRGAGEDVGAVAGLTTMTGEETFPWLVAAGSRFYNQSFDLALEYERVLWATTSNLACRRAAFDRIGGFDPDTPTVVGGEDVDFGVRLCEAGYVISTNPDARVLHTRDHVTKLRQIARSLFTYGRADVYLLLRHPRRSGLRPFPAAALSLVLTGAAGLALVVSGTGALRIVGLGLGLVALAGWGCGIPGRLARRRRCPAAGRFERFRLAILAYTLDASFRFGRLREALGQRRPDLLRRRFRYGSGSEFARRREPDVSLAAGSTSRP